MVVQSTVEQIHQRLRRVRNQVNIYRKRLSRVDASAYVHGSAAVSKDLVAGPYAFVGPDCRIEPQVSLGKYTMLAAQVAIIGGDHEWTAPGVPAQFAGRSRQEQTIIGDDVWLGHGVVVLRGVTIGDGVIVGAGAVITKSIPAFEVWAGVPARRIRDRFTDPDQQATHERMLAGPLVAPAFASRLQGTT